MGRGETMNGTVEALQELRRLAAVCWRCEGRGLVQFQCRDGRGYYGGEVIPCPHALAHCYLTSVLPCPSCAGTGEPERVA